MTSCLIRGQKLGVFVNRYLPLQRATASPRPLSFSKRLNCNEWLQVPLHSGSILKPIAAADMSTATASGMLEIERVKCLSDNYSWLLHDPSTGATAVVDPAETAPVVEALRRKGWNLTTILNTHHHSDHVGGNLALKARYNATIIGPAADVDRIPGIDIALKDGDSAEVGNAKLVCFDTPAHTKGHVTYFFADSKALFPGDTLFSMGCGRLFEGTPAQMWSSLQKLIPLPDDTQVYCAHEYTQSNARFALSIDGNNPDLQRRKEEVDTARAHGEPTIPCLLGDEKKVNPFLRPDNKEIREALGVPADASNEEAFAAIRAAKDRFR
ncbi:hypothetical protein Ndes2526B_g06114 [Nannochloris sp. 'desiccata']|nr:hypothetical protein KSW81_007908 [Chlorella desiccata (nom. nud.)]KAH7619162.1 putative Hydroxyacylglutathione hydrolase 2, mitochondrial [Chlorella desiccata (nom. nud.)]